MFNKVFEEIFKDSYIKGYELIENYDILDIIKMLQDSNVIIKNVYINEDADLGLKNFEGNYSLDKFLVKYNEIKKYIDSIVLDLEENNRLYLSNKNYVSLSSNKNIEINDLLEKEKKL